MLFFYYNIINVSMNEVDFLKYVVDGIVEHKEDVVIETKDDELGTLLTLQVHKDDMGIIIGKKGATVNALRSIMRLMGMKLNKKINLKVID